MRKTALRCPQARSRFTSVTGDCSHLKYTGMEDTRAHGFVPLHFFFCFFASMSETVLQQGVFPFYYSETQLLSRGLEFN